jgi:glycosidase
MSLVYNSPVAFSEDKIYFMFIDRFHDGAPRNTIKTCIRKNGYGHEDELHSFYGGTFKGIIHKLAYIKKLGFTAIWISPFFHNTDKAYHGYAIKDFTNVDLRFGSKEELNRLVDGAHSLGMKVYMDVIINHTGDVWHYLNQKNYQYNQGLVYPFGSWSEEGFPKPETLRNIDFFERKGQIKDWMKYPELAEGDFFELKKFKLNETGDSLELQNILVEIYSYWIQHFDFDGFRIDTVRHMSPLVINRFTHRIKQFANSLGKMEFPVFIEAPFLSDSEMLSYFKTQTDRQGNSYLPPDGFLDFYLHFDLPDYMNGRKSLGKIRERFRSLQMLRNQADSPVHQVTFLDNHDQVAETNKQRITHKLNNKKIAEAWQLLLDLNTIPCLYYGTEQGLSGAGPHDKFVREAMFQKDGNNDLFDENYILYKNIQQINRMTRK